MIKRGAASIRTPVATSPGTPPAGGREQTGGVRYGGLALVGSGRVNLMSEGHRLIQPRVPLDGQREAFRTEQALMSVTIKEPHNRNRLVSHTDI